MNDIIIIGSFGPKDKFFNKWVHVCQSVNFITSEIVTVANGLTATAFASKDPGIFNPYYATHTEENPLGKYLDVKSLKGRLVIGLSSASSGWVAGATFSFVTMTISTSFRCWKYCWKCKHLRKSPHRRKNEEYY